jgi:3-hydroxyisobutyrate dehydrogenase-like beta-hydroxyacid dehydrogenase
VVVPKGSERLRVGYIGVGLMGHGAAKNILLKGYPITVLGHRNRAPVDDLVAGGAKEAASLAELANASDVVFTCLPSSIEVEATVFGDAALLAAIDDGRSELDPADRPGTC